MIVSGKVIAWGNPSRPPKFLELQLRILPRSTDACFRNYRGLADPGKTAATSSREAAEPLASAKRGQRRHGRANCSAMTNPSDATA
jgi:hypothetical protein